MLGGVGPPGPGIRPTYADAQARRANRDSLTVVLDAEFQRETTQHCLGCLQGLLPVAPVYDLPRRSISVRERDRHGAPLPHPVRPDFRVLANPIKLDASASPRDAHRGSGNTR